jgi:ATP-dependent Clp protease ATP-binding subunit ClpA
MRSLHFGDYADKLSNSAQAVLVEAIEESRKRDLNYLTLLHLSLALLRTQMSFFSEIIQNTNTLQEMIEILAMEADRESSRIRENQTGLNMRALFSESWNAAVENKRDRIEAIDFIKSAFQTEPSPLSDLFRQFDVSGERIQSALRRHLKK